MVAAIIVLFHPELKLITRLRDVLATQVQFIILIDNTPSGMNPFSSDVMNHNSKILYHPLGENFGIAAAQNAGIQIAKNLSVADVIFFDQDTVPSATTVEFLKSTQSKLLSSGAKVAAVGPVFVDRKNGSHGRIIQHGTIGIRRLDPAELEDKSEVEADYLISSGSMVAIDRFSDVGLLRTELFIDWVDIEWCKRAADLGHKCYVSLEAKIEHQIGDSFVNFLGRRINLHSVHRNVYIIRNAVYLLRYKYMGLSWRLITLFKVPMYVCFYAIYSNSPVKSFLSYCSAILHGFKMPTSNVDRV